MINHENADFAEAQMYDSILRVCIHEDRGRMMECMRDRLAALVAVDTRDPQHLSLIDAYMALITLAGTDGY